MAKHRRDENELTEAWRDYHQLQQVRRAERLPGRQQEIMDLARAGFTVRKVTDYQFRIDGQLDLYPTHRRWHNVRTGKRGGYQVAKDIACRQLKTGQTAE